MIFPTLEGPYFHILVGSIQEFGQCAYKLNYQASGRSVVRVVRGSKMKRVQDLFNEFSAAFQFPFYFGENWPAFAECLLDLEWLPGEAYTVLISETTVLLSDDDSRDLATLMRILDNVCSSWARKITRLSTDKVKPTPFHVLFHADESQVGVVQKMLSVQIPDAPIIFLTEVR
jgi:hypothetical protein